MVKPNLMFGLIHAAENTFGGHSDASGSHHPLGIFINPILPIFANLFFLNLECLEEIKAKKAR